MGTTGNRASALALGAALLLAACTAGGSGRSTDTSAPGTSAAPTTTATPEAKDRLPLDTQVRTGVLDNGLTYYVRPNDRPGGHASLRLVVNAGSAREEADQSGVAHFLEHMMFNGTEKYAKNDLIDVLERSGSGFGADINAYTSFDETVYQLDVSNTDEELGQGLDILHEWLTAATLDPAQVESERGVVLDEFRTRTLDADGRVFSTIQRTYLAGTPFEGREPIGTKEAIEGMTADVLRRFYDAWYRPDNAAVVVVGDIDVEDVLGRIESLFGSATPRGDSPDPTPLPWQVDLAPRAVVVTDPDLSSGNVELAWAHAHAEPRDSLSVLATSVQEQLVMTMLANRLRSDISAKDAPYNSADASSSDLVRPLTAPSVYLSATNDDVPAAAEALLDEFARVKKFGFSDGDVSRAVDEFRTAIDAAYERRDTRQDAEFADGLVANFLAGELFSTAKREHDAYTGILDDQDRDTLSQAFGTLLDTATPVITVSAKEGTEGLPDEAALTTALSSLGERTVQDREDTGSAAPGELMSRPEAAAITDQGRITGRPDFYVDPYGLTFANGLRVILNPTDIVDNQVQIFGVSAGGFSVTAPEDVPAVWLMNEVNTESGLGDLTQVEVDQIVGDSTVDVSPYPSDTTELFRGSSSTDDLELMLQVIHQYVVASNFDEDALQRAVDRNLGYVEDPTADPDLATELAVSEARYGSDPRYRVVLQADELRSITTEQLSRVWNERFGDASDFVYVIAGDFDTDTATDLAARYLGTLPSTGSAEEALDVAPPPPAGVVTRTVKAGSGATAQVVVQYTAPSDGSAKEAIDADVLEVVLSNRLTARIREELGATYSPDASVFVSDGPPAEVVTRFTISGAPADMARIATVLQSELDDLRAKGPSADEVAKAVAQVKEEYGLIDNGEVIQTIVRWWFVTPDAIEDYANAYVDVAAVKAPEIRTFAARVLPAKQYIQVTQLPR